MKKYLVFAAAVLLMLALCGAACANQTTTVLIYMCAGSDMQNAAQADLREITGAQAGDDVNVVILAGGAKRWSIGEFRNNTRTLAVIRDGSYIQTDDWGRKSMGSPESLREFLEYGLTQYPADRTMVILWNHGAGSGGGVCIDETANDDGLTVAEINDVMAGVQQSVPGFHVDIFGCDACMMAAYEMVAVLSHYNIDCYIGSEETEPEGGWYYAGWLEMLKNNPSISNEDLCIGIVNNFMEAGLRDEPDDMLTLSAIRLSEVPALQSSMEDFASVMAGEVRKGNVSAISRGRSRMYTFGSYYDGSWDMVDLGTVLDTYAQFDPTKAAEAKRCLTRAVIISRQTDNLAACCGLSVLIPQDTTEEYDDYRDGFDVSGVIPNWIAFVSGYADELLGGSYHFSASEPTWMRPGDFDEDECYVPTSCYPGGCLAWDDEAEDYDEEPTEEEEIRIDNTAQGFTATLPQEDLPYLDYVEGMLLMDLSDNEGEGYVDFGTMRNNLIDWQTGKVVSLYDGTWPVFGGQPVPMYDQASNANSRRSLIPVQLNGEYTYLVVEFPAGSTEGRILGANAGYDDSGLPIRSVTALRPGDEIIPVYTMYVEEEGKEDLQESEFKGDKVTWKDGMTVTYEDLSDEQDPTPMLFCFVFNDIFGKDTMSEMIEFEL